MQIGVFSDIHGDLAALTAVWNALGERGLTSVPVLNAGDNVGYGEAPEACVEFLRGHPSVVCVAGNYDRHVAGFPEKADEYRKKWGKSRPPKYEAIQRDSEAITDASRSWLRELPKEQNVRLNGVRVLLTHYSPGGKEGLGPWTPTSHLEHIAARCDAAVVVCGHTHTPFVRRAGHVLFVNPGTVGRGWHHKAAFAVVTLQTGTLPTAQLHQVTIP